MDDSSLDRIDLRDVQLRCVVGVDPEERGAAQDVTLQITLYADLRRAGRTDRLEDTVDYRAVTQRVAQAVEASSYQLVERLAERVAEVCLSEPKVQRVRVRLAKPGAMRGAPSAAVEIVRERENPT